MSNEEILSYYDDEIKEIGRATRSNIHSEGLLHMVVHCWVVDKDKQWLYFQQRAFDKKDFPGFYDICAAGHIFAGEKVEIAAIREIEEEIGLIVEAKKLKYVGSARDRTYMNDFNNNEICQIYMCVVKKPKFLIGEEVEKIVKIPLLEYEKFVFNEVDSIRAYSLDNKPESLIQRKEFLIPNLEYIELILAAIKNELN